MQGKSSCQHTEISGHSFLRAIKIKNSVNLESFIMIFAYQEKAPNQERPYKQLLHYWSRHLRVVLEQFRFTSLFNQHLGVLVSAPEPHLHPKLPWVLPPTPPQAWYTVKPVFHGTHIRGRGWLKARERALLGLLDDFKRQLKLSKVKPTSQDLCLIFHNFCHATSENFYATNDAKPWRMS